MKSITEFEFQRSIKALYESIFANEDPYRAPLQPDIQPRLLLYQFRYGLLEREPWLNPITKAVRALGEDGFYLTLLGRPGKEPWHWYVPLEEAGLYVKKVFPRENAMYSTNGRWGIICSEEDHAIVGGPQLLIDTIREFTPDLDYRVSLFINIWTQYHKDNKADIDWLPTLLAHIYGPERANKLILDANLP